VIRNGINDKAQDEGTGFAANANWKDGSSNGNGAVAFRIADDSAGKPDTLVVKSGKFLGDDPADGNPDTVKIRFTTEGYRETAEVHYAVKGPVMPGAGYTEPASADYTSLGSVSAGQNHQKTVTITAFDPDAKYYVYVILTKDGKAGKPLRIRTKGGVLVSVPRHFSDLRPMADNRPILSDDFGQTWTTGGMIPHSSSNNINFWYTVAYGGGRFIALGGITANEAAWSDDYGETWTSKETGTGLSANGYWLKAVYAEDKGGNGRFVAIDYHSILSTGGNIAYSDDGGENWTMASLAKGRYAWRDLLYANGRFVAIGDAMGVWSDDGINWTTITSLPVLPNHYDYDTGSGKYLSSAWSHLTYGDGKFVAVSYKTVEGPFIAYSGDGINWTNAVSPLGRDGTLDFVVAGYGGGRFVAMYTEEGAIKTVYSTNGQNWNKGGKVGPWFLYNTLISANDVFILMPYTVQTDSGKAYWSTDAGQTWQSGAKGSVPIGVWQNVAYGE
jgi:hypothetical protein